MRRIRLPKAAAPWWAAACYLSPAVLGIIGWMALWVWIAWDATG